MLTPPAIAENSARGSETAPGAPNVVGLAQAAAESAIAAAGFAVGSVTTAASATVPIGRVISQNPAAGASASPGSGVNLVVSTREEETAPSPIPMTFAAVPGPRLPSAGGDPQSEITMTATAATDPSGVEYLFDETSGNPGGTDSGWQDSPVYTDTGLQPDTTYTYTVTARDKSPNRNVGGASAPISAKTAGLSGFRHWATGPFPSGLPLTDPDPALDFDGGGLPTSIEWVVGGDPTDGGDDHGPEPVGVATSAPEHVRFHYRLRNEAASDPGTSATLQYSTDLNGWRNAIDDGSDIVVTTTPGAEFATVEVKIKSSLAVAGRLFARLRVVVTP